MTREFPQVPGVEIEHRTVRARGLRFHVALAGPAEAEPLVLLHGWPQHWYEWRKLLPELAERRRCVLVDLRGLGWSEAPPTGYEKETLADDVLAVLDELAIDSCDLIAHDWGAWVGFLIALRSPARLRRFLVLNMVPPWPPWPSGRPSPREALGLWRLWYQVVLATPWLGEGLLRRTRAVQLLLRADNVHADAFSEADLEVFAGVLAEPARARASSLIYRDFLLRELLPVLRGRYANVPLTVPTHLLFGVHDGALAGAVDGITMVREGDSMTVELVEDSGHFIAEERPDLVLARAREHLDA
ncbi:MAG TPA: alpha/beta hydrolase [Solirubrobacteraceae bacterium]|nr:alpha/beta hydrolase [Solirubrobacteraceae bacterium]